jgi:outer membrane protein OmpA-like peptidoglycan-associated protein
MKKTLPLVLLALTLSFCSEEKKLLRQASNAVDRSDFEQAISYYDKVIQKNDNSFFGHAGKGIVLSEYMARHEQAIPELEKALASSPPEKTKSIVHGNLGKSYHFIGNYKRALQYYSKVNNDPSYADYDQFLTKRIADCKFAIEHPEVSAAENCAVNNVGDPINTPMPEYTPIFANGHLYFTSKRQDDPKEKKNGVDGRFFEAIYASKAGDNGFSEPTRLKVTLPEEKVRLRKSGEAIASATPDGEQLFIYKEGKIFTMQASDPSHKLTLMDKNVNFSNLQNHAAISPDGNTLFFTSEAENGRGGSDIYFVTKDKDGKWSEPQALSNAINTTYSEEAPFMNEGGVLFFASNGHPGYGGFDIYRTQYVNGAWTQPVNLGQPINSPGDDIFFTLSPNSSRGFYASARPGGKGDMDIYRVHYVITDMPQCKPAELLTIETTPDANNPMAYNVQLKVPDEYKNNVRSYAWEINGKPVPSGKDYFTHTFDKADIYKVTAKVVAGCDTCPRLVGMCTEKSLDLNPVVMASAEPKTAPDQKTVKGKPSKVTKGKGAKGRQDALASASTETTTKGPNGDGSSANSLAESSLSSGMLSESDLKSLNWNTSPPLFTYNDYSLQSETKSLLDQNIDILKKRENLHIIVHGYADSRGSAEYNKRLSARRADAVKQYLVNNGVTSKRIKTKAHGEEQLFNNCSDGVECDESQHSQNRRVSIDVINTSKGGAITSR